MRMPSIWVWLIRVRPEGLFGSRRSPGPRVRQSPRDGGSHRHLVVNFNVLSPAGERVKLTSAAIPARLSADRGTWCAIQIVPPDRGNMPIHPRQAFDHPAEIQGREFSISSPFQAREAQTAACADRSVGLDGGPPDCICSKSSRLRAQRMLRNSGNLFSGVVPVPTCSTIQSGTSTFTRFGSNQGRRAADGDQAHGLLVAGDHHGLGPGRL